MPLEMHGRLPGSTNYIYVLRTQYIIEFFSLYFCCSAIEFVYYSLDMSKIIQTELSCYFLSLVYSFRYIYHFTPECTYSRDLCYFTHRRTVYYARNIIHTSLVIWFDRIFPGGILYFCFILNAHRIERKMMKNALAFLCAIY